MADLIDRDALLKDMGLTDAVKYGNKDAEQQYRSYSTWMSYEIADAIRDAPAVNRNASDDIVRDDESKTAIVKTPELIDRHALLKNVYDNPPEKATMTHAEWCRKCIYEAPTIEAGPVRHGRWIPTEYDSYAGGAPVWDKWECSECGHEHSGEKDTLTAFCPDCGAKMYADGGTISRERFAEIMGED